ncbi:Uma2 family endonuclease [Oscillatoria sp. FACHB-1406]|uniref:Uma2 family endonuclease n=1 Tax=Oscillatoria sp. FACHB-1406 TaxID=2692846 RepID=UPI0016889FB0|nr:Uma2 family endonuclease [Oscillatoria sp. FACHB-1406]MBD2577902.1 Uma2 family endonuclease [Oscillatoria sp. FACHB-1406]
MMVTTVCSLDLEAFFDRYGDDYRYELIDGELIEMEPTGPHEEVVAFLLRKFNVEIDRLNLPWFLPSRCLIQLLGQNTAFRPDVLILDKTELTNEPLWQKEPIITLGNSVKLVAEVVSTNWQNDYARKAEDYAALGIPEYWIVDYLGLGGRRFIGSEKLPTVTVNRLVKGEYESQLFRAKDCIVSPTFPQLKLTAEQIFSIV